MGVLSVEGFGLNTLDLCSYNYFFNNLCSSSRSTSVSGVCSTKLYVISMTSRIVASLVLAISNSPAFGISMFLSPSKVLKFDFGWFEARLGLLCKCFYKVSSFLSSPFCMCLIPYIILLRWVGWNGLINITKSNIVFPFLKNKIIKIFIFSKNFIMVFYFLIFSSTLKTIQRSEMIFGSKFIQKGDDKETL